MDKRRFLRTSTFGLTASVLTPGEVLSSWLKSENLNQKKALVLGGRGFIGPSIVRGLMQAGYDVTLLNRGNTNPHLFQDLPLIKCDRETENREGLRSVSSKIRMTNWNIVVDTWQKSSKAVEDFLSEFKDQIGHYHYISTISVYDKWDKQYIEETEPLNPLPSPPNNFSKEYRYAIRKTLAEEAIRAHTNKYTIYRSSGMKDFRVTRPKDPDAEPFWPVRFQRGGEILVPKIENHHIQFTDVQSLVAFLIKCAADKTYGAFNVASYPTPFKDYVSALIHATQTPKKIHWIDGEFLKKQGLTPYKIVPFWRETPIGAYAFNIQKAIGAGLINRPISEMITDQLAGYNQRYPNDEVRFGELLKGRQIKYYSMDKEKKVIENWLTKK